MRPDRYYVEKITDYRMVEIHDAALFSKQVNYWLKEGWSLYGDPGVSKGCYYQAMVISRVDAEMIEDQEDKSMKKEYLITAFFAGIAFVGWAMLFMEILL